jgi:hypothetical protein
MDNPFPGMNPFLEQPELWTQVHNRLIIAIADDITPQVAPHYLVTIEERVYQSTIDALIVGVADVALSRRPNLNSQPLSSTATANRVVPAPVRVPVPEEVTERFLEVRSTKTGEVVCVVEVLSPKNKRSKDGRAAYENKRQKILGSNTSLVEIDLLRVGEAMPLLGAINSTYRILVSQASRRPEAELYAFGLRDPLPDFPVPLRDNEPEAIVHLQQLLNEIYQRARFDLAIDYSQPLKPAVSDEDVFWMRETLHNMM